MTLDRAEAHHLLHVLRLKVGDSVTLFDGKGGEAAAEIVAMSRSSATVRAGEVVQRAPQARLKLTLAVCVPKGKHADMIVEKGTELGMAAFLPVVAQRNVADPRAREEGKLAQWRRVATESCKQCGRSDVPAIEPVATFKEVIGRGDFTRRLLAMMSPEAVPLAEALRECAAGDSVMVVIGPEGGLTEAEEQAAVTAGFVPVSLGPNRLRVETAAIAVAAVCALAV